MALPLPACWRRLANDWLETALDLAYPQPEEEGMSPEWIEPPFCLRCGEPNVGTLTQSPPDCTACREQRWHFLRARAACRHRGRVRDAVLGFKFSGEFFRRRQLVDWLVETWDHHESGEAWDGVVPVPLHLLRRRERGFNQSHELAAGLAKARDLPLLDCLSRVRYTTQQTQLDRADRLANLRDAFAMKPLFDVRGRHLLIIDDVYTTGATAEGCARVLHEAGADAVAVLTVSRG